MTFQARPHPLRGALVLSALLCLGLYGVSAVSRPLFPIDETRYLTVAWEMRHSGNWILPTLNWEAYDHKPPALFWLINLFWTLFGFSQKTAMAVPFVASFSVLALSGILASRMRPSSQSFPFVTTVLLAGSLPFLIYSPLIMFDVLLTGAVLGGLLCLWQYVQTAQKRYLLGFALAVGTGALIKGPVILLHLLFPVVLVRFWKGDNTPPIPRRRWVLGFLGAVLLGAVLALFWAIPAGIEGGPEFRDKIFWGQTAGRMVKAFDHQRPFWWYSGFVPLFLVPWIFSPALWRGFKSLRHHATPEETTLLRFVLCWIVPVFLSFSLISGKQVHYLLPMLPGVALVFSVAIETAKDNWGRRDILLPLALPFCLSLLPFGLALFSEVLLSAFPRQILLSDVLESIDCTWSWIAGGSIFLLWWVATKKSCQVGLLSITASMALFTGSVMMEAKETLFPNFDLTPIANVLASYPDRPIATVRTYHGEFGFLAQLTRPVTFVHEQDLPQWLNNHPKGLALLRVPDPKQLSRYDVLFQKAYRTANFYAVVAKKQ